MLLIPSIVPFESDGYSHVYWIYGKNFLNVYRTRFNPSDRYFGCTLINSSLNSMKFLFLKASLNWCAISYPSLIQDTSYNKIIYNTLRMC